MYRTLQSRLGCSCFLSLIAFAAVQSQVRAVDRLVPGTFATIDAAEAASSAGDRIIVSPGTYTTPANGLVIDVANLQLLSTGGAGSTTIQNNTATKPVIIIQAPGVIIGDVAAGFTIKQQQAASDGIEIDATQVKFANPVRIQYNTITGNNSDDAIYLTDYIENGGLIIQENTFSKNAGTTSFYDVVYFDYSDHSSNDLGDVSLINASVDILNNTATDLDSYGVYVGENVYSSNININGNRFTSHTAGNADGIYFSDEVSSSSVLNILENTLTDMDYGVYIYWINTNSTCTIDDNTATGFAYAGIYLDYSYKSVLSITNNELTGNGTADYGIYGPDSEELNTLTITGNQIAGIDYAGIYVDYVYYASTALISDNGITSNTLADYGIYCDTEYGSETTISNNVANGFDYAGVYEDYPYYGSTCTITGNTLTGAAAGPDYGIYCDPSYTSTCTISGNTCTNFDYAGIYFSSGYYHDTLTANDNTLTALPAGADYGIYFPSIYESSSLTCTGNNISGFDLYGVYSSDCYDNSTLDISNNTLTGISTGADYGIYVYEVEYGSTGTVNNNTCTNWDTYGIYWEYAEYGSHATTNGNTLTALSTGGSYGIEMDYVEYGSSYTCDGNVVTGYNNTGLYPYEIYEGSSATVTNNTATAHSDGADYGVYNDYVEDGSSLVFSGNSVTGYGNQGGGEYGFYSSSGAEYGSTLSIQNNTFTAHSAGSEYGIYSDGAYEGSFENILDNTITGYDAEGIYSYYGEYGSEVTIARNVLTPLANAGDYGIDLDDGFDDSSFGNISNNTINSFTDTGIWINDIDYASRVSVNYNTINGDPNTGGYYGIYIDDNIDYGSYFEAISNSVGGILGDAASDSAGINTGDGDYINDGSEAVVCDNFIRGRNEPGDYMAGIYAYYTPENGSKLTICNNDVAGFSDAQILLYDDITEGSEIEVTGNVLNGGHFGVWTDEYNIGDGSIVSITRNIITGFDTDGVNLGEVYSSTVDVSENKITGNNSANGIIITDTGTNEDGVNGGSHVTMFHNCIASVQDGIEIETVLDSAFVFANQNDFDGVLDVGIKNAGAGTINGENNFFGAVPNKSSGNVDIDPESASSPDADGDGVSDCDDQCFDTASGDDVDATGCSCIQLNPTGDTDGDGTIDCDDGCPNDPNKTSAGACGCGTADTDADADGVADCVDDCVNGVGSGCPALAGGCCGAGSGATMAPMMLMGMAWMGRRRWKNPVRR
jgi:hypothetical protein